MPGIFLKCELSPALKFAMNGNCMLAWLIGGLRDTSAMKQRLKLAYDGAFTNDVERYDETGAHHFNRISKHLLEGIDLREKRVIDVGCGTGITSGHVINGGAASLVSGDQSEFMLGQWKKKAAAAGIDSTKIEFRELDAEHLPFSDDEFDVAVSSMVMGMIPDQLGFLSEMKRVLKPGGILALSAHGPRHYQNISEITFRVYIKKGALEMMGYRVEYWPWDEKTARKMLNKAGFKDQRVSRMTWEDEFESPEKVWEFYASTTSLWWSERFSKEKNKLLEKIMLDEFRKKQIHSVMQDVIFCHGRKE